MLCCAVADQSGGSWGSGLSIYGKSSYYGCVNLYNGFLTSGNYYQSGGSWYTLPSNCNGGYWRLFSGFYSTNCNTVYTYTNC